MGYREAARHYEDMEPEYYSDSQEDQMQDWTEQLEASEKFQELDMSVPQAVEIRMDAKFCDEYEALEQLVGIYVTPALPWHITGRLH